MEPTIKVNNDKPLEVTLVSNLVDKKNIDNNYIELMKLTEKDLSFFDQIHYGKIKFKKNIFDKVLIDEIKINKYGNINLVNCIYMIVQKDNNYFKNSFIKFDTENNQYEYKCYQGGQEDIILFGNKVIKNTEFIHPPEGNYWIFFIEKAIAKLYKNYINTYNLLASELYQNLSPFNIQIYQHIYYDKKDVYKIIKEKLNKNNIIFCEIDPLEISVIDNIKNKFISFYINNIFKINVRKYL